MANNSDVAVKAGGEIAFDAKSGISEEEQREILADINGIAERNRRSLASAAPAGRITAQKNGGLFPLAVNGIALLLLAGGFFLLSSLHNRNDVRLREGTQVFSPAERALINEIRKETLAQLEEKENEINRIIAQMREVDLQLRELHSSNRELSGEQLAAEGNLENTRDGYRLSLSALQDDRARILESAHAREAVLYAQLEARTLEARAREPAAVSEQKDSALNAALGELERLGADQEKAAAIEAQLGAYFASADEHIRGGEFEEAAEILNGMRQFLDTPAFQGIRSFQAQKDFYVRSIDVLETLAEEVDKNPAAPASVVVIPDQDTEKADQDTEKAIAELAAENARLEARVAELNRTVTANSQGSNTNQRRLAELENSVATLRGTNTALESAAAERETAIANLESRNAALTRTVEARDSEIRELHEKNAAQEQRITSLDTQLTTLRQTLQALSQ